MTTTVPPAGMKPRFFVLFPTTAAFVPEENGYIYFFLPAGKSFPSDLTKVMNKAERYINFEDSEIEGVETQTCEGTNCVCSTCRSKSIVCRNESCAGFIASTDGIECSDTTCVPTNSIEYTMYPLYPDFMSAYSPKFKFMRYIRGGSSATTPMPSGGSGGDHVLFSVSFPSMEVFATSDKFKELQASITAFAPTLKGLDMYEKHNTAMLQRIIKNNNKLSRDMLDVATKKPSAGSATQRPKPLKGTMSPADAGTKSPRTRPPARTQRPTIVERYEDEDGFVPNELTVPKSDMEDTDNTPVELLTPEPDFLTASEPSDKKLTITQILMIVAACIVGIVLLMSLATVFFARRKVARSNKKPS